MKTIEIIPRSKTVHLYDELVEKEAAIREGGRGTFFRAGRKTKDKAKWKHKAYRGSVNLARGKSEHVTAKIRTHEPEREWQMLSAFLGFVDRHLGGKVATIRVGYL